jgi:hypothetical protein
MYKRPMAGMLLFVIMLLPIHLDAKRPTRSERDRDDDYRVLSTGHQRIISDCFSSGKAGLPPGLAKKDRLPPGLEKQLRRNGKLPPGLQKKIQPLDSRCQIGLPRLPDGWERVIYSDRVIVLDPAKRIIDWARITLARAAGVR